MVFSFVLGKMAIQEMHPDSLNLLADAVRRSDIEWVGVRHEEGASLAAVGQAKLTGRFGPKPVQAASAVDALGIASHRSHSIKIPTRASRAIQWIKRSFKG
jgi:hypothetical protein